MTLGTRVAVMRDGIVEQIAPALDVFRRPANAFVAGFVGSPAMNLWPCTYDAASRGMRTRSPVRSMNLIPCDLAIPDGSELLIGVRPHDIDLAPIGDSDGTGRIDIAEPLGPVTVIHVRVHGLPSDSVRIVVPSDVPIRIDEQVGFRVRRDRVHAFDGSSGRRLN